MRLASHSAIPSPDAIAISRITSARVRLEDAELAISLSAALARPTFRSYSFLNSAVALTAAGTPIFSWSASASSVRPSSESASTFPRASRASARSVSKRAKVAFSSAVVSVLAAAARRVLTSVVLAAILLSSACLAATSLERSEGW